MAATWSLEVTKNAASFRLTFQPDRRILKLRRKESLVFIKRWLVPHETRTTQDRAKLKKGISVSGHMYRAFGCKKFRTRTKDIRPCSAVKKWNGSFYVAHSGAIFWIIIRKALRNFKSSIVTRKWTILVEKVHLSTQNACVLETVTIY